MSVFYTDYPFRELGDTPGQQAPVRSLSILSYDGNKYCEVMVEGVRAEVKAGYIYESPGRVGEVTQISNATLALYEEDA